MKRWRGWLLILTVIILIAGVVIGWRPRHGVTPANFKRLTKGMARSEVDAILGPPRSISHRHYEYFNDQTHLESPWVRRAHIQVIYDHDDRVDSAAIAVGGLEWWERFKIRFGI